MDNKYSLGGEAVRLTISKVVTLCITMITTMLLSRFRTIEEYGTYSQILLIINLFISLLMLGLPNSINFFLARAETKEERQHFLSVFYTLSTILSIIIGTVLVLCIPLIESYFHNKQIHRFYYFLALYPWASIILSSIENILVVYRRTQFLMAFRIIYSAVILGITLLVQFAGYGFTTYMIVFVAVNALFAVFVYIVSAHLSGGIRPLFDKNLIRSVLAFSIPLGLATVVGTLNAEIDKLLIGYLMDTEQLAIYTNAAKELPLSIVAASITAVLLPQLTRMIKNNNSVQAINLWGTATELAFIVIAVIVAGVFAYAEEAMTILYSEKYLPGVNVFRIYTLNLLLRCTYFGIVLNAYGETKKIFWCSVLSLVLNSILNPFLFWIIGVTGPAIATFIAILAILLLQLAMTSKTVCIPFKLIFPWKQMGVILIINILFCAIFKQIKNIMPLQNFFGEIWESIILGAIWLFIYFLIMKKRLLQCWHCLNDGGEENS